MRDDDPCPYVGPRHLWRVGLVARTLLATAPPVGPLLDAGCGDGTLALALAGAGRAVVAFDLDPARLRRARRSAASAGRGDRVLLLRADATAMPFGDAGFAGAAAGDVLEHLARDDLAMREIARVLAPGGVVALTLPAGPRRMSGTDLAAGHVRRYDRAMVARLIEGAGLRVVLLRGWGLPFGRAYDRWVQRPALAARDRPAERWVARLGRSRPVAAVWRALFAIDERVPAGERGSGWVAVGRKKGEGGRHAVGGRAEVG